MATSFSKQSRPSSSFTKESKPSHLKYPTWNDREDAWEDADYDWDAKISNFSKETKPNNSFTKQGKP